jgi:hypothetical protein
MLLDEFLLTSTSKCELAETLLLLAILSCGALLICGFVLLFPLLPELLFPLFFFSSDSFLEALSTETKP